MFNLGKLVTLALGEQEAKKVDFAIPLGALTPKQTEACAGWYYSPEAGIFGAPLWKADCWRLILAKMRSGEIKATMYGADVDLAFALVEWPCLQYHVEHDEVYLEEVKRDNAQV